MHGVISASSYASSSPHYVWLGSSFCNGTSEKSTCAQITKNSLTDTQLEPQYPHMSSLIEVSLVVCYLRQ